MELDLGPEIREYRAELRAWIAAEAPEGLAALMDWNAHTAVGTQRGAEIGAATASPLYAQWESTLLAEKLICPQWPAEYGGQDMDPVRIAVFDEELYRAGLPRVTRGAGESLVGPSVIAHGTPEQKAHFLPPIISGDHFYCQGFAEPDHGSDLASLETRGVVDGQDLVITGKKVWTSGAAKANMMFILCRTDPDAEKHAGISYVLIDFTDPRIDIRPVKQISGASEFCEEFLDGVRVPLSNVIGGLNNGWRVANTTLGHERSSPQGSATVQQLGFERQLWELIETARQNGKNRDPLVRQQLASAYTCVELMRYGNLRTLSNLAEGRSPGAEASVAKLFWGEYLRRIGEIALGIEGTAALVRPAGDGYPLNGWQDVFLAGRAATIYAGSSEIQRNIISERVLGLPRESRLN
jgi:alkylation response protein AidB-like acyl-CoA dehydrogenase